MQKQCSNVHAREIHKNNLPPRAVSDGRGAPLALDVSDTTTQTAPAEWLKATDCKSAEVFYVGSNPASPNSKYTSYFQKKDQGYMRGLTDL
jgi:hypothetical protein